MKAFLLAAGLGTRLRPLTLRTPKCLLPVNGKPLLSYWFDLFTQYSITDVLINTHYLPEKVNQYFKNNSFTQNIKISYESVLLGSAGTVLNNKDFIRGENEFFICYADNLTNANLFKMLEFHRLKNPVLTCALFEPPNLSSCGVVTLAKDGLITDFEEKPQKPKSRWANAGIFIASPWLIDYIPKKYPCDFGFDVLPKLINKSYGYRINEFLMDIGTTDGYYKANELWPQVIKT